MKKNTLNEEILNQIRLITFDRSKTLIEQSLKKVEISGKLTTLGGKPIVRVPCQNCWVVLIEDNINKDNSKLKKTPYIENLWKNGEVPINYIQNTRTDNEGNFYLNTNTVAGMYALIMGGGMKDDDTTIYFDITKSQNINFGTIDLPEITTKLDDVTLFAGELKVAYEEFLKKVEEYNILQNSNSTNKWNINFPSPSSAPKPTGGWTTKEIKKYTDQVEKELNNLKNKIEKGKNYLIDANKLTDTSKLKPLDVINGYMTKNGYNTMNELRHIDHSSYSVFMQWYKNDGQFSDPSTYKLSDEEIKYIRDGWKRKLETSMQLIDAALSDMARYYHTYSPYIAMALYFASIWFPPAGWIAVGIEGADALIYALYDKDYYMAGLTAAFAIWGAVDMSRGMGFSPRMAFRTALKFEEKKIVSQAAKKELQLFLKTNTKNAIKLVINKSIQFIKELFKKIFKSVENAIKALRYLNDKINFLPNILQKLVKMLGKMMITLGGVVWTWDKLASFMGLCNTSPFLLAYATWDAKEHWWISNLLLKRLVGYMGLFQTSTTICGQKELEISAVEAINDLNEDEKKVAKELADVDEDNTYTEKQIEEAKKLAKKLENQYKLNKQNVETAKTALLKKSDEETSKVLDITEDMADITETVSQLLIKLDKDLDGGN